MDCNEFRNSVADLFDKEVAPQVQADCERHLAECPSCRAYYEGLRSVDKLLRPQHSPIAMPRREDPPVRRWQRIAAMLVGIALLGGVVWAIVSPRLKSTHAVAPQDNSVSITHPAREGQEEDGSVYFDEVRLDSILTVVAGHYGKAVQFRNDEAREIRLIMMWNPADSLVEFIGRLNRFEGLQLTLKEDTLMVEFNDGEDE